MTIEPPKGIKANLQKTYLRLTNDFISSSTKVWSSSVLIWVYFSLLYSSLHTFDWKTCLLDEFVFWEQPSSNFFLPSALLSRPHTSSLCSCLCVSSMELLWNEGSLARWASTSPTGSQTETWTSASANSKCSWTSTRTSHTRWERKASVNMQQLVETTIVPQPLPYPITLTMFLRTCHAFLMSIAHSQLLLWHPHCLSQRMSVCLSLLVLYLSRC